MTTAAWIFHQVRRLIHRGSQDKPFIYENNEQQGEVSSFDDCAIEPDKLPHGHKKS